MILLDKPLVSDFLRKTIQDARVEALDTGQVILPPDPILLNENEAIEKYLQDPGMNLHTTSENALKWIYDNLSFSSLPQKIGYFKDKVAFRELVRDMYPDFFYRKVSSDKLEEVDLAGLPIPFIIKPATGFFSMGVHKVFDAESWEKVKEKISREKEEARDIYPEEVLGLEEYIIEECIEGDEYAFDAYYNDEGRSVLMGVMHHPFSGENDVSDRVYNTSREILRSNRDRFTAFLDELGKRAGLKNFSLHVEVRIDTRGNVVPIEVNPLRFGAWCTSADLTHYAFGFNPYSYYVNKQEPDWDEILDKAGDSIYSIIILENSTGKRGTDIKAFDHDRVVRELEATDILEIREIDYRQYPIFSILFTRTLPENYAAIEKMLGADMSRYITLS